MQEVVQFVYGGDNFDATHLVKTTLPLILMSDLELRAVASMDDEFLSLKAHRDEVRRGLPMDNWNKPSADVYMPFHAPWIMDTESAKECDPLYLNTWYPQWICQLQTEIREVCRQACPLLAAYVAWHCRRAVMSKFTKNAAKRISKNVLSATARAIVAPAEMVGALAAQSCGEPTTQLTLNTFHKSGMQHNVSQGVPRLKELLNITNKSKPKTPIMSFYLSEPACYNKEATLKVARGLPVALMYTLVQESGVRDTPFDALDALYSGLLDEYHKAMVIGAVSREALVFFLDAKVMRDRDVPLTVVATRVAHFLDAESKTCAQRFQVLVGTIDDRAVIRARQINTGKRDGSRKRAATTDDVRAACNLNDVFYRLQHLEVFGVHSIRSAHVNEVTRHIWAPDGSIKTRVYYQVSTQGVNVLGVCGVARDLVTNDVVEVCNLYGLEAATKALFYEIKAVLCAEENTLHDRHIMLIVDTMTRGGSLMPMNRHGLNKRQTGPLVRSSFEQTVDVFNEAAVFGERDTMSGVSENVMAGQLAPLGTGCMDILPLGGSRNLDLVDEDDVVFSTLGDVIDGGAYQHEPCLPHMGPGLDDVPSLPCHFDSHHNVEENTPQVVNEFVYCPRSPAHGDGALNSLKGEFIYCPRSP